jgi:hypothetical protein
MFLYFQLLNFQNIEILHQLRLEAIRRRANAEKRIAEINHNNNANSVSKSIATKITVKQAKLNAMKANLQGTYYQYHAILLTEIIHQLLDILKQEMPETGTLDNSSLFQRRYVCKGSELYSNLPVIVTGLDRETISHDLLHIRVEKKVSFFWLP